jgi:predicted DNA-binding protein
MIQLEVEQIEQLDKEASRAGVSRSEMVRNAVEAMLHPPLDVSLDQRYAEAYPEISLGRDDWGDLDAWHEAASTARAEGERDPW